MFYWRTLMLIRIHLLTLFTIFTLSASLEAGPFDDLKKGLKDVTETSQQQVENELTFPAYSPLGRRIANGEAVYSDVFYWINADGTIGATNSGWSRVPKPSRHLVYLDRKEAEQAVLDASISPEERRAAKEEEARLAYLSRCDLPFSKEGIPRKNGGVMKTIDGILHYFYPGGQLDRRGKANEDNKYIGLVEYFSEDCKLTQKGPFNNDSKMHGVWEYYREDGTPLDKGPWKDGEQHGVWEYYKKDGSLNKTLEWEKGENVTAKKAKAIKNIIASAEMIPFVEACEAAYLMKGADAQRLLSHLEEEVSTAVSEGKISSDRVNRALDSQQRVVDMMGGFGWEQKQLCAGLTVMSAHIKKPSKRF